MNRDRSLTKNFKAKAKWLIAFTNKFMKQEMRKEDLLFDPDKMGKWKVVKKNLYKIIGHPDSEFEIEHGKYIEEMFGSILDKEPVGPERYKEVGLDKNDYHRLLEYFQLERLVDFADFEGALKKCKTKDCGKLFLPIPKHKEYCNSKCASKDNQRTRRDTDRKKYNEDIQKYRKDNPEKVKQYYMNSLKKKRKKEQESK